MARGLSYTTGSTLRRITPDISLAQTELRWIHTLTYASKLSRIRDLKATQANRVLHGLAR